MTRVDLLVEGSFGAIDGELRIGGVPVGRIAEDHGTPCFVYDLGLVDRSWAVLRQTLPSAFSIYYSVKANPNPVLLRHFLAKGAGLEIASAGEFHQALRAGCAPDRILFAGPGKTDAELERVLAAGIGEIHLESVREAERVAAIARRLGRRAPVAVRVNPTGEVQGGAMRMGGQPAPFGIDEETLDVVVDKLLGDPALELRGVHLFTGTQILEHTVLTAQYRKGVDIARRVAERSGRPLATIDFGGGLGIPYFASERDLDMVAWRPALAALVDDIAREPLLAGARLVVEPGRYLVGEAGVYVTRITDVKVSRGKKFLVVDGGMNHHLAASGNLGQVIKRNFPVAVVTKLGAGPREVVDVVGPLCTPLDVLARDVELPCAAEGDLVGIFQSGAYARTASPLGFLSHPSPPEVVVRDGTVSVARRRGTLEALLADVETP